MADCCPHCDARRIAVEALTEELAAVRARLDVVERAVEERKAQAALLGAQGGKARKKALSVDERKAIARHAANTRWRKPR